MTTPQDSEGRKPLTPEDNPPSKKHLPYPFRETYPRVTDAEVDTYLGTLAQNHLLSPLHAISADMIGALSFDRIDQARALSEAQGKVAVLEESLKACCVREKKHLSAVDGANAGRMEWFRRAEKAEAELAAIKPNPSAGE